jgi:lipopolysaccharide transport protein LptA
VSHILALILMLAAAPPTPEKKPKAPRTPLATRSPDAGTTASPVPSVKVDAENFKLEARQSRATYWGKVKATRGQTQLLCDRLIAYFNKSDEVTRVECMGGVEIFDQDRWARGEHADFDNLTGVLELTGNPEIKQGTKIHSRGSKITFYVGTETLSIKDPQSIFEALPSGLPLPGKKP